MHSLEFIILLKFAAQLTSLQMSQKIPLLTYTVKSQVAVFILNINLAAYMYLCIQTPNTEKGILSFSTRYESTSTVVIKILIHYELYIIMK